MVAAGEGGCAVYRPGLATPLPEPPVTLTGLVGRTKYAPAMVTVTAVMAPPAPMPETVSCAAVVKSPPTTVSLSPSLYPRPAKPGATVAATTVTGVVLV